MAITGFDSYWYIYIHMYISTVQYPYNLSVILCNISFQIADVGADVGLTLMKWVYTDKPEIKNEENFLVDLVKAANRYKLTELRGR